MKGTVNGVGINGTALPNWVVRAVVVAVAASTVNVEQTRTTFGNVHADASVVVTLTQTHTIAARATGTAECSHYVAPTIIHAAAASTTATAFGAGAVRRDVYADAGGDATASAIVLAVRQVRPTAFSTSTASVIALRARQRHQSAAQASSQAISEKVQRLYTTFGHVDGVLAHASLLSTTFGQQVFGLAQASALSASQQANTTRNFAAAANTQATASSNLVVIGRQFFADSFSQSQSHTLAPNALIKYRAQAIATTVSDLVSSTYGTQHRAIAQNVADSSAATVLAIHNYAGRASGYTIATSDALGFANSDKLAPDERYMIVPQGVREMTVFFDEREMKVAA